MKISIKNTDSVTVVQFEGSFDSNTALEAKEEFKKLLDQGIARILVDFSGLDYISSAGLRVLLGAAKRLNTLGGSLRICNLNEIVNDVFLTMGFDMLFKLFETETEALEEPW